MTKANELFLEIEKHLLMDEKPSDYLNKLFNNNLKLGFPFDMIVRLQKTEQSPIHHPEGNVWNHTLLVVDEASKIKQKSTNQPVFMWAALLHDIGKPDTTRKRKDKITSYDHDKVGAKLAKQFLEALTDDDRFIQNVVSLIRWHMQILFVAKDLPFADINNMKLQADVNEIALLGLCDRLGRLNPDKKGEENNIELFLQKTK